MSRLFLSTALDGLMMVSPSFADINAFSTIDVSIDMTAVQNKAAAVRYAHISDDLKSALLAMLVDRIAEVGAKLTIDLSEVELSNSFTETSGTADTHLVGLVSVSDPANNSNSKQFTLIIDVNQAKAFFPAALT